MARMVVLLACMLSVWNPAQGQPPLHNPRRVDLDGEPLPEGAIARLGSVRFQLVMHTPPPSFPVRRYPHWSTDTRALFSPDGKDILVFVQMEKDTNLLCRMDALTGKYGRFSEIPRTVGVPRQFMPDGKTLVCNSGNIVVFADSSNGAAIRSIEVDDSYDLQFAVAPDGKTVALQPGSSKKAHAPVSLLDSTTGKLRKTIAAKGSIAKELSFSSSGKRLLLSSIVPTISEQGGRGWGPDNDVVITCIDVGLEKTIAEATVKNSQQVVFASDGETIAFESAKHDRVTVFHLPSKREVGIVAKTSKFRFSPDAKSLFTLNENGVAELWDSATGDKLRTLETAIANKDFRILGFSGDGTKVAAIDGGWESTPTAVLWDLKTGKRNAASPSHQGAVTCLAYAPQGKLLISGSLDKTVRLWSVPDGVHLAKLADHDDEVTSLAVSADGKMAASACKSGRIQVCSIPEGNSIASLHGGERGIAALAFSADGKSLFLGNKGHEWRTVEIASAKTLKIAKIDEDGNVLAFAPGATWLLSSHGRMYADPSDDRVVLWNTEKATEAYAVRTSVKDHGNVQCQAATFSQFSRFIAFSQISVYQGIRPSYGDAKLQLLERTTGNVIRTLAPSVTRVLALSPDERYVAAGAPGRSGHLVVGYGGGIDFWDGFTGEKIGELPISPRCAAWSPDGSKFAAGGGENTIIIWETPRRPKPKPNAPTSEQKDRWWTAMGGLASEAYPAIGEMLAAPDVAIELSKERLKPAQPANVVEIDDLIRRLESKSFADRGKAQAALESLGELASGRIEQALKNAPNPELRRRMQGILKKSDELSAQTLRQIRAVAFLEWSNCAEGRNLLQTLAGGEPTARLTKEAKESLARLAK